MSGLTELEMGTAFLTAGSILMVLRYWRFFAALAMGFFIAKLWSDHRDDEGSH